MKRRIAAILLAGAMTASMLTGCAASFDNNATVVTVDGDAVPAGIANFYARMMQAQYETMYAQYMGATKWETEVSEGVTMEDSLKEQIMNDIQNMYLLEDHMEEYGVTVTEEEQAAIAEAAEAFDKANKDDDKDLVSGDVETIERFLTLCTIRQKVEAEIEKEADTNVSDEEAAQKTADYVMFSNYTVDDTGATVELDEEGLAERDANAAEFAEKAKTAADLSALAEEYEEDVRTASFDSDESTSLPAEVVAIADKMKAGEVSEVIETENGLYVVKLTSEFDREATDAKKDKIVEQRKADKFTEVVEGWREAADIKVDDKVWGAIDFTNTTITMKMEQ